MAERLQKFLWPLGVILVSAALHFWDLGTIPFAVHGDVGEVFNHACMLQSPSDLIKPSGWWGMPGMMLAPGWASCRFGYSLYLARLPDALFGILFSVMLFCYAAKRMQPVFAFLFAIAAASSPLVLHTFRLGLGHAPPCVLTLAYIMLIAQAYSPVASVKNWLASITIGITALLAFLFYLPGRVVTILFALQLCYFGARSLPRKQFAFTTRLAAAAILPLLGFGLFTFYAVQKNIFLTRSNYLYSTAASDSFADRFLDYAKHLGIYTLQALGTISFIPPGDNGQFYLSYWGFLDWLLALLGLVGVVRVLFRQSSFESQVALIGSVLSAILLGGILKDNPEYHRLLPLYIFWIILAVEGLAFFLARKKLYYIFAAVLACQSCWNTYTYFETYAVSRPDWTANHLSELSFLLKSRAKDRSCAVITEERKLNFYATHATLRLIPTRVQIFSGADVELCQKIEPCLQVFMISPSASANPIFEDQTPKHLFNCQNNYTPRKRDEVSHGITVLEYQKEIL